MATANDEAKWAPTAALVLLSLQSTASLLVTRHVLRENKLHPAPLMISVELCKFFLYYAAESFKNVSLVYPLKQLSLNVRHQRLALLYWSLPAALFTLQNRLLYYALPRVNPVPFQIIQQLKIPITAILSVIFLKRSFSQNQWSSLLALTCGVTVVQLSDLSDPGTGRSSLSGYAALLLNSISSSIVSIYMERLLKSGSPLSLNLQSMQLSLFGILFSTLVLLYDPNNFSFLSLFSSGTWLVPFLILLHAIGGILVAYVTAYTSSINKGFASALSIVFSGLISLGSNSPLFLFGSFLVCISTCNYALASSKKKMK